MDGVFQQPKIPQILLSNCNFDLGLHLDLDLPCSACSRLSPDYNNRMVATDGDAGPKRAGLRGIVVSVSLVALLSAGGCFQPPSYRIEKTITLPDLFAGPSYRGIAYDSRDNRILIPFQQGGTLVIDATTVRKVARVPASGPGASTYDPVADEVHLPPAEPGSPRFRVVGLGPREDGVAVEDVCGLGREENILLSG